MYKLIFRGFELYKKEQNELQTININQTKLFKMSNRKYHELSSDEMDESEDSTLINEFKHQKSETSVEFDLNQFSSVTKRALLKIEFQKDKKIFPFNKVIFCFITYFVLLLVTLLKGSDHFNSIIGIKTCSLMYWSVFLSYLPVCIVITYIVGKIVYEEYHYRKEIGYPYHSSDIMWTKEIIGKYPLYALSAGVLSGLLGIGGGLILGPLLLDLGIHPVISTATSNFLVVFISSSTTLQYIMLGMMNFNYGIICTILSTLGSYVGTLLIQRYLEKTKRSSILVFTLAVVLGISTICVPCYTLTQLMKSISDDANVLQFNKPC